MESILARALEYTLKYWLKSFSRDQLKLHGRTVQLSNLDINGDAIHASLGLPPALNVATAKVGKLEIILPSLSYVQVEPIVVQIDRLDLVLKENDDVDACANTSSKEASPSPGKGSGYGFADKIADGMTLEVGTVNLLVETHGGSRQRGGATWASPMASITIRNLFLYTTNEKWQVVDLKEARDFSTDKKFIYVFKKLEWQSLSIDLLPHPDMFAAADALFASSQEGSSKKDDDGAKRVFFGGERFIEGISGQAYITIQRTDLNSPLGLEVQLHITEVVCPALSEPGLRALLRFFTGFSVCLNRGDVNPNAQERSTEAAGRSLVSIIVDHIFLGIKDVEFRLELLMQSLSFSRTSVSDGETTRYLTHVGIGGLFVRDTFSNPPCTLVQPSTEASPESFQDIPEFADSFCPPIYPLEDKLWQLSEGVPLVCILSLQVQPSPASPSLGSETVINCQPLMVHLQEDSCLKIISLLADGTAISPDAIVPDPSLSSLKFNLTGLDITVPLDLGIPIDNMPNGSTKSRSSFTGATVHIGNLSFSESPSLKLKLLNLEKDPACFCLWEDQPIDTSQKKWRTSVSLLSLSLDTSNGSSEVLKSSNLWRCAELKDACIEVAMATADGSPLINVPPPGGLVRIGVACQQYLSSTSVEQLFFILDVYAYFGRVSEKMAVIGTNRQMKKITRERSGSLLEKVPSDTAVSLSVNDLLLKFLETSSTDIGGTPLAQFHGENLFVKVSHRTLGGALAISSSLCWESVEVECTDTDGGLALKNDVPFSPMGNGILADENGSSQLRAVFWVQNKMKCQANGKKTSTPFLDISMVHVIPFNVQDLECHSLSLTACIAGVRLGGGMSYAEALLHRFGILGPDGGPGKGLTKGLENLSAGPLSKLFKPTPLIAHERRHATNNNGNSGNENLNSFHLSTPDDVDVSIEFRDWLFALEGLQETSFSEEGLWLPNSRELDREERSWHTTFQSLLLKAKSCPKNAVNRKEISLRPQKLPVELVMVGIEGLQILKPHAQKCISQDGTPKKLLREDNEFYGGINMEVSIILADDLEDEMMWEVEDLKFSVKQPIEVVVRKEELQLLASLCKAEVDSLGRIAAGVLRILKLEGSVGQAAIHQLNNLGTDSFDKIFTPERLSRGGSVTSIGYSPSFLNASAESTQTSLMSTVVALEEAVFDSQVKCAALTSQVCNSELPLQSHTEFKELSQKLEGMQNLLARLRSQI